MANIRISAREVRDILVPFVIAPNEEMKRNKISLHQKRFTCPTYEQVMDALKVCRRHLEIPFQEGIFECEFKSMCLTVDIGAYCSENKKELDLYYRWSFGLTSGLMFEGEFNNHTLNLVIVKPKVYFIDSTNHNKVWEGNPKKDLLIEVWM